MRQAAIAMLLLLTTTLLAKPLQSKLSRRVEQVELKKREKKERPTSLIFIYLVTKYSTLETTFRLSSGTTKPNGENCR